MGGEKFYVINPKTGKEQYYSSMMSATAVAVRYSNQYKKSIRIYNIQTGRIQATIPWDGAPQPKEYRPNPSRLTNAARQASYYFDDPRTGKRKFDSDMERLKRSAARIDNEVGQAIGIFTAAATGPTRKGKKNGGG